MIFFSDSIKKANLYYLLISLCTDREIKKTVVNNLMYKKILQITHYHSMYCWFVSNWVGNDITVVFQELIFISLKQVYLIWQDSPQKYCGHKYWTVMCLLLTFTSCYSQQALGVDSTLYTDPCWCLYIFYICINVWFRTTSIP